MLNDPNIQIIPSFFLFAILFYTSLHSLRKYWKEFGNLDRQTQIQFVSRAVSCVNALIVTLAAAYVLLTDESLYKNKLIYRNQTLIIAYNLVFGYLFYDLLCMLWYRKELFDWQFVVHHLVSSIACFISTNYGYFAFIAAIRSLSEASTLFVNMRWFLLSLNMKNTQLYTINGLVAFISFGLVRIVTLFPIWKTFFQFISHPQWSSIHFFYKFLCIGTSVPLDMLNIYWYYRICMIVSKTYKLKKI